MIGQVLAAGVFVAVPVVGLMALRGRRFSKGRLTHLSTVIGAGVAISSAVLLIALTLGLYRPAVVGACGWVVSIAYVSRFRFRDQRPGRAITPWSAVLVGGLVLAAVVYVVAPADPVITGRDMAVYAARAAFMAMHGRLDVPYPDGLSTDGSLPPGWTGFAGLYSTQPTQTVQFGALYPAWLAQAHAVAGMWGVVRLNALFAVLAAIPIFVVARRWVPEPVAAVATLYLAFNASQVWVARNTLSEIMTQLFVWTALLLLTASPAHHRRAALAWAGALIGLAAVVRIDGLVILPLIVVGHAIAGVLSPDRYGPRAVAPFYLAAIPTLAAAVGLYVGFANPYFTDLVSELWLIAGATGAAAAAYVVTLLPVVRGAMAPLLRSSLFLKAAMAACVGLALFAYIARPGLEPLATIDAPTHPLHGTRSHIEDAMGNLGEYLGGPVVWMAVVGWVGAMALAIRRRPGLVPILVVAGGFAALYFWNQSIFPDHFWAIRRFVPVIIPAAVVLAAVCGWFVARHLPRGLRPLVFGVVAIALALQTWRAGTPLYLVAERAGSIPTIQQFAEALPEGRTYLGLFTGPGAMSLATPLFLMSGVQVIPLDVTTEAGRSEAVARLQRATEGVPVSIITNLSPGEIPDLGRILASVEHDYELILPTTNPVPSQVGESSFQLRAMEVTDFVPVGLLLGSEPGGSST